MSYTTTDPGLLSYQGFSNGLVFGPGTDVQLVEIDGLRDATQIASGDIARARRDGVASGTNNMVARILTLTFMVFAPSRPFEDVVAAIALAFQPRSNPNDLQLLQFMLPGWASPRQVTGRTTQVSLPIDTDYQFNKGTVTLQFTCPDPLIYDSIQQDALAGLPSPTAGLTFPASAPFIFGASAGGSLPTTNTGNREAPFVCTIHGPMSNPLLRIGSDYLGFDIVLGENDVFVIDTFKESAKLNGASRTNLITTGSKWLTIPVGTSSIAVASSDATAVTGDFLAEWANTWGYM